MNDPIRSIKITIEVPLCIDGATPNDVSTLRVQFNRDGDNPGSLAVGVVSQRTTEQDWAPSALPRLSAGSLGRLLAALGALKAFLHLVGHDGEAEDLL